MDRISTMMRSDGEQVRGVCAGWSAPEWRTPSSPHHLSIFASQNASHVIPAMSHMLLQKHVCPWSLSLHGGTFIRTYLDLYVEEFMWRGCEIAPVRPLSSCFAVKSSLPTVSQYDRLIWTCPSEQKPPGKPLCRPHLLRSRSPDCSKLSSIGSNRPEGWSPFVLSCLWRPPPQILSVWRMDRMAKLSATREEEGWVF